MHNKREKEEDSVSQQQQQQQQDCLQYLSYYWEDPHYSDEGSHCLGCEANNLKGRVC